jgi:hypothetical protein
MKQSSEKEGGRDGKEVGKDMGEETKHVGGKGGEMERNGKKGRNKFAKYNWDT